MPPQSSKRPKFCCFQTQKLQNYVLKAPKTQPKYVTHKLSNFILRTKQEIFRPKVRKTRHTKSHNRIPPHSQSIGMLHLQCIRPAIQETEKKFSAKPSFR